MGSRNEVTESLTAHIFFKKKKERAEFPHTRSMELPNHLLEISDPDLGDDFVAVAIVLSQNPTFPLMAW